MHAGDLTVLVQKEGHTELGWQGDMKPYVHIIQCLYDGQNKCSFIVNN